MLQQIAEDEAQEAVCAPRVEGLAQAAAGVVKAYLAGGDDVSAAALWLQGTEAEKHLADERGRRLNVSAILKKRRSCSSWLCVPLRAGRAERLVSDAAGWTVIAYMASPAARHTWFISNLASSELR